MNKKKIILSLLCCLTATLIVGCAQSAEGGLVFEDLGNGSSASGPASDSSASENPDDTPPQTELTALAAPQAVYYDGISRTLSWNTDALAENGWSVKISQGEKVCINERVAAPIVALDTLSAGEYRAELQTQAVAEKYAASAVVSYAFTVAISADNVAPEDKMPQAQAFTYDREKDLLKWNEVAGNDGYVLEIYAAETRVLRYDGTVALAETASLPLGEYTAKLVVSGDGVTAMDSEPLELDFMISSFGALIAPTDLTLSNGMLTWDALPHTSGVRVEVCEYQTGEPVSVDVVLKESNQLSLAELGVPSGKYKIRVAWESTRHDQAVSDYAEYGLSLEYAVQYTPEEIVRFDGNLPIGEHGGAQLVTENGETYAEIYPTVDGWGRVGGTEFSLNFDRNPIVFISVGYVYGGYHLQLKEGDTTYLVVPDSNTLGNISADIVSKTGLSGTSSVYLRLGVNGSTSTDANDARVRYKGITVFYAEEIKPPETVKLNAVTDMKLDLFGRLQWNAPTNGECDAYDVRVQIKGTDTTVYEGTINDPSFALYDLKDGAYTVSVTAKNTVWQNIEASDEAFFHATVSSAARYTAADLDTATGKFQTGAQNIEATYDEEKGYTLFNSTNKTDWGWISPKEGITVDMSRNPLVVISTQGVQGGFFAKQEFDGQSITDVLGNTSLHYDGAGAYAIRANANSASQNTNGATWSGQKTGYKFHLGSLGKADGSYKETCRIYLTGISVVYVSEYIEIPNEPIKLSTPANFTVNGSKVQAMPAQGNAAYTPVYEITVSGDGVLYTEENAAEPAVDLGKLSLAYGATYTVRFKALGDGTYFTDSEASSIQIQYALKAEMTDFTNVNVSKREGEGSILSQDANGLVYGAADGKWVLFAIELSLDKVGAEYALELNFGTITDGTRLAGRYYTSGSGAENTYNLGGDSAIVSDETRDYSMEKARLSNGKFYLGIGMGGDSGDRQIELNAIRVWGLEIVKKVEE